MRSKRKPLRPLIRSWRRIAPLPFPQLLPFPVDVEAEGFPHNKPLSPSIPSPSDLAQSIFWDRVGLRPLPSAGDGSAAHLLGLLTDAGYDLRFSLTTAILSRAGEDLVEFGGF